MEDIEVGISEGGDVRLAQWSVVDEAESVICLTVDQVDLVCDWMRDVKNEVISRPALVPAAQKLELVDSIE